MPLYEYECLDCGAEFEKLVMKTKEIDTLKCPVCESSQLEEKVSGFSSSSSAGSSHASDCAPSGG